MPDLADGESIEMKGSAAKPYLIRNIGGVYSCSCPAWRNQSHPPERRTCKHIRKLRGEEAEKERLGGEIPKASRASKKEPNPDTPDLLLAQSWDTAEDLTDWWMSEKLDGVRAYWDGKRFLSRQGNQFHAPDWFVEALPEEPLDGELWIDRGSFQRTVSVVRRQDKSEHWQQVRFLVFDAPGVEAGFEDRIEAARDLLGRAAADHLSVHDHIRCEGLTHLRAELARVEQLGGEGLMLRQPQSVYEIGRSFTLLKVKTFHDAEAVVVGHQAGRGKHKGKLGSLLCELPDGTSFSVGTGFTDRQREEPPEIGSTVTFRYQELSDAGVPRFPSFVALAEGVSVPSIPTTPSVAAKKSKPKAAGKKKSAAKPKSAPAPASGGSTRRFEFDDGKSSKFWEVTVSGSSVTVRYGRIGSNGTSKTKEFDDAAKAEAHAEKEAGKKVDKGYDEIS